MSDEKKNEVLDKEKELDEAELDAVSGGDRCVCALGGGGKGSGKPEPYTCQYFGDASPPVETEERNKTCACVVGGVGKWIGGDRCVCVIGGDGEDK